MNQYDRQIELISAQDASVGITSVPYLLNGLRDYSLQVVFSDTSLEGSLTLECSNNGVDFITVKDSTQAITAGAGHIWDVDGANYRWVRMTWAPSDGTGTMTAYLEIKGIEG